MVDFKDEEISIERLAVNYYEGLRLLAAQEGLYGANGSEFRFRHGNGLVLVTFDPFSTSWDPVEETPIGRNERALSIEFRTRDLEKALYAFGVVANKAYEGKPVRIIIADNDLSSTLAHRPSMQEIPANFGSSYRGLRGNLDDARILIVAAKTRFFYLDMLEVPSGSGPVLWGDDLSGRSTKPTTYRLIHRLVGAEGDVMGYARVLDKALSPK